MINLKTTLSPKIAKVTLTIPRGLTGKSAYQSYVDTTSDNPVKTEAEWVASLGGGTDNVKYVPQTLTSAQKSQARTNIAAASLETVGNLSTQKVDKIFLTSVTSAPNSPSENNYYYNSTDKKIYRYDGANWVDYNSPLVGTIYIFSGSNYLWNGSELFEVKSNDVIFDNYDQLVAKINSSSLVPGKKYLIADFRTIHYLIDGSTRIVSAINVGNLEPILVTATSNNSISETAESLLYPKDIIHYDWNPANWLGDKCLTDENGSIITGFKGFIHRRIDTVYSLDIPYDFRNVKFRLWGASAVVDGLPDKYSSFKSTGTTGQTVPDVNDFKDLYLFTDVATTGYYSGDLLFNIKIEFTADTQAENIQIGTRLLPNLFRGRNYGIVLKSYAVFNILGENCKDTTLGRYSEQNIVGALCHTNRIADNCVGNIISYGQANVLDSFCSHNVFYKDGLANTNNILGYNSNYNTFHNGSSSNKIGVGSNNNSFAGYNNFNVIGNACSANAFGYDSDNNVLGNYSSNNTFGQQCKTNVLDTYCANNTFGNNCSYNHLKDAGSSNTFPVNFSYNVLDSVSSMNFSDSKYVKLLNKTFITNVRKNTDGTISIQHPQPAKTITLTVAGWSNAKNANGFYQYAVADAYLMANDFIDAVFANADIEAVLTAGIKPSVTVADGSFIIEAESIPTSNLTLTYKIL